MFFKHFACKNQLPGLFVSGTLVENGLMKKPELSNYDVLENRSRAVIIKSVETVLRWSIYWRNYNQ